MSDNQQIIVSTQAGALEGIFKNGLYVFKGIPYAAPPTGNLRWMTPQPVKSWSGVRSAKDYGPIAPQNLMPMELIGAPSFEGQPQSEDCLFLNIWTPGLDDARRPVFFWIHGGAFIIGAGTESFLEDGALARRGDIVVVSINYRLGALGFMNLKEITGGTIPATGNEGLLDQIAALDWVRDNITAFGGDPDNVTISGFSAGGMSVGTLLSMPAAYGKFHKAHNRSGAANIVGPLEDCVRITEQYLKILHLKGKDVDALRSLNTRQILDTQQVLSDILREQEFRATPFQPVVDGNALSELPMSAIKKGVAKEIPIMSGTSLDELKCMNTMDPDVRDIDDTGLVERLSGMIPAEWVPSIVEVYRQALNKREGSVTPAGILGSINTDWMFRIPTIRLLETQRDNGAPAYHYLFVYKSPAMDGLLGAVHGLDNPFLFGSLDEEFTGSDLGLEDLALKVQDSCAAFVRSGDPSCNSVEKWPVYGKDRMTMLFDRNSRVEAAPYEA
ncbi:MAG: carboxylesterase/lipase family protein [Deltaproteobacteria bacterium]|nr:carboxylesterase/lipase family protein [Deltaproteobacteria bacterium]